MNAARKGFWSALLMAAVVASASGGEVVRTVLSPAQRDSSAPASGGAAPGAATTAAPAAEAAPLVAEQPAATPAADDVTSAPRARENYRIGPGDVLDIRVLGEDKMTATVKVTGDGYIRFPYIDEDVQVQCLTERDLGTVLAEKLRKFLKFPEVFVTVKEFNSSPVAIMGAVNTPGRFQMQRKVRLIELLTYAGGVKTDAGRVLTIIHVNGTTSCDVAPGDPEVTAAAETVNVKQLLEGDPSADRVMRPGDIVILPVADLIFVAGEVLKPNAYPLRDGMTLSQALAVAGGPSSVAKVDGVRIVRNEPGKPKQEIPVDLKAIQANTADDPVLMANDVIEIPGSSGKKFMRGFLSAIGGSAGQLPLRAIP